MSQPRYLFLFGTRPEAIKLSPLILEAKKRSLYHNVCFTGQHKDMVLPILKHFQIEPDLFLNIMKPNQSLNEIVIGIMTQLKEMITTTNKPTHLVVQGDTTSAAVGALYGFYESIKVIHIEAGLRTHNLKSPWPEEFNRRLIGLASEFHFVPTKIAYENLKLEGVPLDKIHLVGNTGIDALRITSQKLVKNGPAKDLKFRILVTLHRRESFGAEMNSIMEALKTTVLKHPDIRICWPLHDNPNIKKSFNKVFHEVPKNIEVLKPLGYEEFIQAMMDCDLIVTDSGGIQEEAPYLGKPTLVCRRNTERPEAIESGNTVLVGTDKEKIINTIDELVIKGSKYKAMSFKNNLFGDGFSSGKILDILTESAAKS